MKISQKIPTNGTNLTYRTTKSLYLYILFISKIQVSGQAVFFIFINNDVFYVNKTYTLVLISVFINQKDVKFTMQYTI